MSFLITLSSYLGGSFVVTISHRCWSQNSVYLRTVSDGFGSWYHQGLTDLRDWVPVFWRRCRKLTTFLIESPSLVLVIKKCCLCWQSWRHFPRTMKWSRLVAIGWGRTDAHLKSLTVSQSPAWPALPIFKYGLKRLLAVLLTKNCLCLLCLLS